MSFGFGLVDCFRCSSIRFKRAICCRSDKGTILPLGATKEFLEIEDTVKNFSSQANSQIVKNNGGTIRSANPTLDHEDF